MKLPSGWVIRKGLLGMADEAQDRRATAIHEAAHAVVAHVVGERVLRLWLRKRTKYGRPVVGLGGACEVEYRRRHGKVDPVTRGVIALAGHEAEARLCGRPMSMLPADDYRVVLKLGCSGDSVNALGEIARRIVGEHEARILQVADMLMRENTLSRRQFLKALTAPDGRPTTRGGA